MAAQARPAIDPTSEPALGAEPIQETTPTEEQIANLAYELWEKRGCPHGSPETDWLEAEKQLSAVEQEK